MFDEKTGILRPTTDAVADVDRGSHQDAAADPLGEHLDLTGLDLDITAAAPVTQSTGIDDLFV